LGEADSRSGRRARPSTKGLRKKRELSSGALEKTKTPLSLRKAERWSVQSSKTGGILVNQAEQVQSGRRRRRCVCGAGDGENHVLMKSLGGSVVARNQTQQVGGYERKKKWKVRENRRRVSDGGVNRKTKSGDHSRPGKKVEQQVKDTAERGVLQNPRNQGIKGGGESEARKRSKDDKTRGAVKK